MTVTIEANGKVTLQIGPGNQIEAVYGNKKLPLHAEGGYSKRFNSNTGDIYFTSPFNKPPTDQSGWLPYAADIRGSEGIFIWTQYNTDGGSLDNVYQVLGFSLKTGVVTRYYKDDGSTLDAKTMLRWEAELQDPTTAYDPTSFYFGSYGMRGEEVGNEISDMFRLFDDIINPATQAENESSKSQSTISLPSIFSKSSADIITNYKPKSDGPIQINLNTFDGAAGKLKITRKSKQVSKFAKKSYDFIYDGQAGYLYYNENKAETGFGEGGIIAILEGKPKVGQGNFEFII